MLILTGAAGFIGSCLLAQLNALGHKDIYIVDHIDDELKKWNLKNKKFQRYFEKKEFLNIIQANRLTKPIEGVIHMGACSSTTSIDAKYYEENNFQYTKTLAQWCLSRGLRLIYASSAATYGDGSCGYKDDEATIRRCRPLNLYGKSKQKFDEWVLDNQALDKVVGLKFFNVFGPNEYHKGEMRSVVAKAYDRVAREGMIELFKSYRREYKDGEQKRDFIYIKDAVQIVLHFFQNPNITGIYNVGTGQARTWNDLARALFTAVGKPLSIQYIDMPPALRPQYQYFTEADITQLRQSGFTNAFTPLEEAVSDYVQYLRNRRYL